MSTPWATSVTPIGPPTSANPTVRQLLYAGIVTGAWSGILCLVVYLIGRACGVVFTIDRSGTVSAVAWLVVLLTPFLAGVAGSLLASLARGWKSAGRIVYVAGTVIAIVSLIGPVVTAEGIPTKILLALMHVISWFLIVPQIARIVGDSEPGRSVERGE